MMIKTRLLLLAGSCAVASLCTTPAGAQSTTPAGDDIVVTAQKRAESIQTVPFSISAYTLGIGDEADRRFVRVLAAVLTDGLDAVEAAIGEALGDGAASDEVILNILSRRREPPRPLTIVTSADLALTHPPVADCTRYDQLRGARAAA